MIQRIEEIFVLTVFFLYFIVPFLQVLLTVKNCTCIFLSTLTVRYKSQAEAIVYLKLYFYYLFKTTRLKRYHQIKQIVSDHKTIFWHKQELKVWQNPFIYLAKVWLELMIFKLQAHYKLTSSIKHSLKRLTCLPELF